MPKKDAPAPEATAPPTKRIRLMLPTQSQVFFFTVLALMLFLTWVVFRGFIIYMVAGVFVAVLALPIDRLWEKVFPNRVAAGFTIFTIILILTIPLFLLGLALYQDANDLVRTVDEGHLRDYGNKTVDLLVSMGAVQEEDRNLTVQQFVDGTQTYIEENLRQFTERLLEGTGRFFVAFTVILFVVYYVLTDGQRLMAYLRRATPLPPKQVDYLVGEAHRGLKAVFVGQILTSVIQGAVGGIGFLIAGLPGVILWSAVMAILSLLPVVGAFLVWVPAGVFLLIRGDLWQGIFLLGWGILIVSQVDNFVRPKLIGDRSGIHPLFVLVGVLGGVAAFGFIGLFLGPLLVGVTVSVLKVWETDYLDPRVLESQESDARGDGPA
ncbi:MAG: AI-2E family transporter [Thermoplasmatota archaeon]